MLNIKKYIGFISLVAFISTGQPQAQPDTVSGNSADTAVRADAVLEIPPDTVVVTDTAVNIPADTLADTDAAVDEHIDTSAAVTAVLNKRTDFVVNIDTAQSKNLGKSLLLALGLSAIVPGGGQIYLNEKKHARPFLLIEAGFWGAVFFSYLARESYLQSAKNIASQYAGIDAGDKDGAFLLMMTRYRSYQEIHHRKDSYEQTQILSGKTNQDYDIPPLEKNYWDFGTSLEPENTGNWNVYIEAHKAYGRAKVAMTWSIGGLVLGRIASLIYTLRVYRKTSVEGFSGADSGQGLKTAKIKWSIFPVTELDRNGLVVVTQF